LRSQAAEEAGLPFSSCIKTLDGATDSSFDVVVLDLRALKISPEIALKLRSAKDDDHLIIFLGQITKGLQGWDCHVCWSSLDRDRREK
jgi:hypothetical protein